MMGLKSRIKRKLNRMRFRRWRDFPCVIQIDTNNHCGPEYCGVFCEYCYPQWMIKRGKRAFQEMPMEWIKWIMEQIYMDGQKMGLLDLFLNGDGLTEPRLPDILSLCKAYMPDLKTQTFTCGTLTENVDLILDKNLDSICFTISAHNRELYKKVHRGDHFDDAIATLEWVLEHRHKRQNVEVHCVLTETNILYAKEWYDFFSKYEGLVRILSPLVASYDNLPSKLAMGKWTLDEMEEIVVKVAGEAGRMWTRSLIPDMKPCVLWDNMSIDVEGYILQCCNWSNPKEWNYGTVQECMASGKTLREVWHERIHNRMHNKLCRSCNMKHPNWKQRLRWD